MSKPERTPDLGQCHGIGRSTWNDLKPRCPFRAVYSSVDGKEYCTKCYRLKFDDRAQDRE